MKIRHTRYPSVIANIRGKSYQFNEFECDVPNLEALELIRSSFEYQPVEPLPAFNKDSWIKERKLLWDGPFGKANGFGNSSEQMLLALNKICDVYTFDSTKQYLSGEKYYDRETIRIMDKSLDRLDIFQVKYGMYNDPEPLHLDYTIAYTMFETTKVPDWRVNLINKDKRLFVPCKHNELMYKECGVKVPVDIVPLGINPEIYTYSERKAKKPGEIFTFVIFGGLSRRKGVYEFLESFEKEFPKEKYPNVRALVKNVKPLAHGLEYQDDRIYYDFRPIDAKEMNELLHTMDCGVFPTKGEGFGLPPIECAATGCPTIVTNISGCADYVDDTFYVLDADLETTYDFPKEWGYVGQWGKVNVDQIRMYMREIYEDHAKALEKGKRCSEMIKEKWTYDHAAKKLVATLDKIVEAM